MAVRDDRHPGEWSQPPLIPLPFLRVDLTVYLDGPQGRAQVGWLVRDTSEDQTLALGIDRPIPLSMARIHADDRLGATLSFAHGCLGPF